MEYQKIINLLEKTPNQPIKFRTKNLIELNDASRGTYNINSKTSMLRSNLCDYSDAYILVKGTITIAPVPPPPANPNNNDKEVMFKNCAPFTDSLSEINNTQIYNGKYNDVVIPIYNLIEYIDNYSKPSGSLWQYYKDEPTLTNDDAIKSFHVGDNNSASSKFKKKIIGKITNGSTKDVEIMVSLKYLSNFCRSLKWL